MVRIHMGVAGAAGVAGACLALVLTASVRADSRNQVFSDFTTPLPLRPEQTLVLGIVGGWERWDNPERITTRIAFMIRDAHLPGVFVETVENHKIFLADELIRRAFPNPVSANLIVYGQSLGGPVAIQLCERLKARGIRVKLLVIIDGIGKKRYTIPSNVLAAANLYQRSSWWPLVGAKEIRAADPSVTRILGNSQYHYSFRRWAGKKIERPGFETGLRWQWMGGHLRMEYDPEVWDRVRSLILNYGFLAVRVTRQTEFDPSSDTSRDPSTAAATPTGRPQTSFFGVRKPVRKSS
jgi:hypothetical protein